MAGGSKGGGSGCSPRASGTDSYEASMLTAPLLELPGAAAVKRYAVLPSKTQVLTLADNGEVAVWDVTTASCVRREAASGAAVDAVASDNGAASTHQQHGGRGYTDGSGPPSLFDKIQKEYENKLILHGLNAKCRIFKAVSMMNSLLD